MMIAMSAMYNVSLLEDGQLLVKKMQRLDTMGAVDVHYVRYDGGVELLIMNNYVKCGGEKESLANREGPLLLRAQFARNALCPTSRVAPPLTHNLKPALPPESQSCHALPQPQTPTADGCGPTALYIPAGAIWDEFKALRTFGPTKTQAFRAGGSLFLTIAEMFADEVSLPREAVACAMCPAAAAALGGC